MIQSRYYLSIILLLLFTSCIRNSNENQLDTPYKIQYLELNDTLTFNESSSFEYKFRLPIFEGENVGILNQYILESVAKYLDIEKLNSYLSVLDKEELLTLIQLHTEQMALDNYDTDIEHLEMFKKMEIDSLHTFKDLIIIEENQESYTGGAHGAYSTNYTVFDLKKKKILKASDVFDIMKLTEIAYDYFLTERGLTKKQVDIDKEGYWFKDNKFHLNDNFTFDSEYVTFLYNPYEIASYSEGQILVEIPLFKVESTIKKEYKYIIN